MATDTWLKLGLHWLRIHTVPRRRRFSHDGVDEEAVSAEEAHGAVIINEVATAKPSASNELVRLEMKTRARPSRVPQKGIAVPLEDIN